MANITVSSDVDTMLQSANNAEIRSNIGAASETQVNTNTSTIASQQTEIDAKAPKNDPNFTGDAEFSNGFVDIEKGPGASELALRVDGEFRHTGDYNCVGSIEVANSSTPPTIKLQDRDNMFGQDSEDITVIKQDSGVTSIIAEGGSSGGRQMDFKIDGTGGTSMRIADDGKIGIGTSGGWGTTNTSGPSEALDVHGNINVGGTHKGNIIASGNLTVGNITQSSGSGNIAASGQIIATTQVTAPDRLVTREIKNVNTSSEGQLPINYKSNEHTFQDYDGNPDNLMVIKKVDNKNGARIGINQPDDVPTPRCALEIHHQSTDGVTRETLRVMGGSFFNEYVRVGHYATAPVDSNGDATLPVGSIIYNSSTKKFQGNVGNANGGWKTFAFETE